MTHKELSEDILLSATAAANTEANCVQKLTSRTVSDGNHLLLAIKFPKPLKESSMTVHMEEYLHQN